MSTMEICGTCGVVAPSTSTACTCCGTSLENNRLAVLPPAVGLITCRLFGDFECRSCGSEVALNHIDLEGYLCGRCGVNQRFDWTLWYEIVQQAHTVADLTGFFRPDANDSAFWTAFERETDERTTEMFRSVGQRFPSLTLTNEKMQGLAYKVEVSPGVPLCPDCQQPLAVMTNDTGITGTCRRCGTSSQYASGQMRNHYLELVGTINHDSRSDLPPVKSGTAGGSGVVAIACPNCNGALDGAKLGDVMQCPFCGTSCLIPARLLQQALGQPASKQAWWMVFEGKSRVRSTVEAKVSQQQAIDAEVARVQEERRRALEQEQSARHDRLLQQAEEGRARFDRKRRLSVLAIAIIIAGAVALVVLAVSVGFP